MLLRSGDRPLAFRLHGIADKGRRIFFLRVKACRWLNLRGGKFIFSEIIQKYVSFAEEKLTRFFVLKSRLVPLAPYRKESSRRLWKKVGEFHDK